MAETLSEMWERERPTDGRTEVRLPTSRVRAHEPDTIRGIIDELYATWDTRVSSVVNAYGVNRDDPTEVRRLATMVEGIYLVTLNRIPGWTEEITAWATRIDTRYRTETIRTYERQLGVNLTAWFRMFTPRGVVRDSMASVQAAVVRNVGLIRNISELMRSRIADLLTLAYREGWTQRKLAVEIRKRTRIPAARSARIARDQTEKLNAAIDEETQKALGIKSYLWRTQLDERVRVLHRHREGRRYHWSRPPRADQYDGHPGVPPGCRCWAEAIVTRAARQRQARGERG